MCGHLLLPWLSSRLFRLLLGFGLIPVLWLLAGCESGCSYQAPPPVSIIPVSIVRQPRNPVQPLLFVERADTLLDALGILAEPPFYTGDTDGATLPLDWQRTQLTYYFNRDGVLDTLWLAYTVQERLVDKDCGFVTEFKELRILRHTFADAKVSDETLRIFYLD